MADADVVSIYAPGASPHDAVRDTLGRQVLAWDTKRPPPIRMDQPPPETGVRATRSTSTKWVVAFFSLELREIIK